ncbi:MULTISPECIES: hypothetical protein [Paenibacillus]|nr:hypothetical protein [Paenibacillus sp. 32352]
MSKTAAKKPQPSAAASVLHTAALASSRTVLTAGAWSAGRFGSRGRWSA